MSIFVFLGPTLPVADAQAILPQASYLPPAAQSDILSLVDDVAPQAIVLIDGVFMQSLSVWHKEILYALERGVAVYGASSMGALRAAETAVFGTVGVGRVFEAFASGELTDDDEVAVMHAPAEGNYMPLSDAMVNVRASLAAARAQGLISTPQHDTLIQIAKRRFFPQRCYANLLEDAQQAGFDPQILAGLRVFLRDHAIDQKREDAIALLTHLRDHGITPPAPITVTRSHPFLAMYQRDRRVDRHGVKVPLSDIGSYAALHQSGFQEINEHALNASLVDVLAELFEVSVDDAGVAAELARFRAERRLRSDDELSAWRQANNLTQAEFDDWIRRLAARRQLRNWYISRKYLERTTQDVLDELRLRGHYPAMADAAASQQALLGSMYRDLEYVGDAAPLPELVREQARTTPWRPTVALDVWAFENGFKDVFDVQYELVRAKLARQARTAVLAALGGTASGHEPSAN